MRRWIVLAAVSAVIAAPCAFLVVILLSEGTGEASVWAGIIGGLAATPGAVAAIWAAIPPSQTDPATPPQVDTPKWWISRPVELSQVVQALTADSGGTVGITTGLHGAGGFGKTVLAGMVRADRHIRRRFGGRVYWVTIGRDVRGTAAMAAKVNDLIKLVTGEQASFTDPGLAGQHLGSILDTGPRRLLVLDDIWEADQLAPFTIGGKQCVRLVTTRVPGLLAGRGTAIRVDQMSPAEARALLTAGLPPLSKPVIANLLAVTGLWPLLLRLVNQLLANYAKVSSDRDAINIHALALLARLNTHGPAVVDVIRGVDCASLDISQPEQRARAIRATIEASTGLLSAADRDRFAELAVFAEDEIIPFPLVAHLWRATAAMDDLAPSELCDRLAELALISRSPSGITLHDVIRDYLRADLGQQRLAELSSVLLKAAAGRFLTGGSE